MAKVNYQKISLFAVPEGSYIAHACNTVGAWGAGIALEFKKRFPHAFAVYERSCQGNSEHALGQFWAIWDNNYQVTCLLVSHGYGKSKDSKSDILKHTQESVSKLIKYVEDTKGPKVIYSNRFNSGHFGIPWSETEAAINACIKDSKIEWIVCDPQLVGING